MPNKILSYDYESSNSPPAAGVANQRVNDRSQLTINFTGQGAADNHVFLSALTGGYLNINGVNFQITSAVPGASSTVLTIQPAQTAPPFGVTNLVFADSPFPLFKPIIPPPVIGVGGGPPPTFPPPTPPPIGAIPPGVLVGPAIAPAPVPPSVAGFPLLQFKTGSATAPTAASWIPQFTTTFPVPTIVVGGFMNSGTGQAGKSPPFVNTPPPQTPSTPPIHIASAFAEQVPPWQLIEPHVAAGALERGVATGLGLTANEEEGPEPPPDEPEPRHEPRHPKRRRK